MGAAPGRFRFLSWNAKLLLGWYVVLAVASGFAIPLPLNLIAVLLYVALVFGLLEGAYIAWLLAWVCQGVSIFIGSTAFVVLWAALDISWMNFMVLLGTAAVLGVNWYFFDYLNSREARERYHAPLA